MKLHHFILAVGFLLFWHLSGLAIDGAAALGIEKQGGYLVGPALIASIVSVALVGLIRRESWKEIGFAAALTFGLCVLGYIAYVALMILVISPPGN